MPLRASSISFVLLLSVFRVLLLRRYSDNKKSCDGREEEDRKAMLMGDRLDLGAKDTRSWLDRCCGWGHRPNAPTQFVGSDEEEGEEDGTS